MPKAARLFQLAGALGASLVASMAMFAPGNAIANVLPTASISSPVKVIPSLGGFSDGTATMSVTFTDTTATATASSPSVGLGPGYVFHVDTCIKAHFMSKPYSYTTTCQEKTVDTTANSSSIYVSAPDATSSMSRPSSTGTGYFSFIVDVSERQSNNSFKEVASSWPSEGLTAASVAVPSVGATTAPAPVSEGAALTNVGSGGINSGGPDSFCEGFQYPPPISVESGVSTSVMGPNAPAYYEVGEPTGAYLGQAPKGIMLIINGGGWFMNGAGMVSGDRADADYWRGLGWRTVNVTYRPCNQSLADVEWFYDQARALWGSSLPYGALGGSAGGNLALLLAAARSTVSYVISEAGPTDGLTIKNETTPVGGSNGPGWVYNLLTAAVSPEMVVWWSPALFPIHARVLWAISAGDPYVPWAQGTELQSKMLASNPSAYVNLLDLPSGTTPWVHANITAAALTTFQAAEQALVAPLVS
jgi:acetyl esterase/lipase